MDGGLGWAILGASWIGEDWFIPAIRESGGRVLALYSRDPDRAASYAARTEIPRSSSSLDEVLDDTAVEAVYVSSTNELHYSQVIAAAAAGKHVLCEKPLAMTIDQGRAMIEACRQAGVVLAVNHHMRHGPTLRTIRRLLDQGAVGRPLAATISHAILLPPFLQTWRTSRPEAGGGVILDLTTHDADTVRFLFEDEIAEVSAITSAQMYGGGVEDTLMGVMRLRSGILVSVHDSYTIGSAPTAVSVHGTDGSLFAQEALRQAPIGEVVLRRGEDELPVDVGGRDSLYVRGIRAFTAAVLGTGRPAVTGEDALLNLAVALAARESARSGRTVRVEDPL